MVAGRIFSGTASRYIVFPFAHNLADHLCPADKFVYLYLNQAYANTHLK